MFMIICPRYHSPGIFLIMMLTARKCFICLYNSAVFSHIFSDVYQSRLHGKIMDRMIRNWSLALSLTFYHTI